MTDQEAAMQELDYGISMAVQGLIRAMGMAAENKQREVRGESPAYTEKDFDKLIDELGLHHNAVLTRWHPR